MSEVSYFQTYSQRENVATNATLLLLSHVHRIAPNLFESFLTNITEDEFPVGPSFLNQESKLGGKSVVDAVIRQAPFEINIETKRGGDLDEGQCIRHMDGMKLEQRPGPNLLLAITKTNIPEQVYNRLSEAAVARNLTFAATTFEQIHHFLDSQTEDFRLGLKDIITDYEVFLSANDLLPDNRVKMIINPCGVSFEQNKKYGIYHDQPERSKRYCRFIGCYKNKSVRLVGEVQAVFLGEFLEGKIQVTEQVKLPWQRQKKEITNEMKQRIVALANTPNYYDLKAQLVRYYVVHKFHETNFMKQTKNGIQGHRYFDLDGAEGICSSLFEDTKQNITDEDVAKALQGKFWE